MNRTTPGPAPVTPTATSRDRTGTKTGTSTAKPRPAPTTTGTSTAKPLPEATAPGADPMNTAAEPPAATAADPNADPASRTHTGTAAKAQARPRRSGAAATTANTPAEAGADPSADTSRAGRTAELVARVRQGDGAAWAELVDGLSGLLWSVARSSGLSSADAADAVQTAWLRLVEHLDRIRADEAVPAWLVTTVRRESVRTAGGRAEFAAGALGDGAAPPCPAAGPDRVAEAREDVDEVAAALRTLPTRCRELLRLLACAEGYGEVAEALGMPRGSVGPTRVRCLTVLRRRLENPVAGGARTAAGREAAR